MRRWAQFARSCQPPIDHPQPTPIRLVGRDSRKELLQLRPVADGRRGGLAQLAADRRLRAERLREPNRSQTVSRCWPMAARPEPDQGLLGHIGVTPGWPSRSPPIQEAKRSSGGTRKNLSRIEFVQGLPQVLQDFRHDLPQHRHDAQAALDFLNDRRRPGTDEVGLPELGQLRLELCVQVRRFFEATGRVGPSGSAARERAAACHGSNAVWPRWGAR